MSPAADLATRSPSRPLTGLWVRLQAYKVVTTVIASVVFYLGVSRDWAASGVALVLSLGLAVVGLPQSVELGRLRAVTHAAAEPQHLFGPRLQTVGVLVTGLAALVPAGVGLALAGRPTPLFDRVLIGLLTGALIVLALVNHSLAWAKMVPEYPHLRWPLLFSAVCTGLGAITLGVSANPWGVLGGIVGGSLVAMPGWRRLAAATPAQAVALCQGGF